MRFKTPFLEEPVVVEINNACGEVLLGNDVLAAVDLEEGWARFPGSTVLHPLTMQQGVPTIEVLWESCADNDDEDGMLIKSQEPMLRDVFLSKADIKNMTGDRSRHVGDIVDWHERLGHPGIGKLRATLKQAGFAFQDKELIEGVRSCEWCRRVKPNQPGTPQRKLPNSLRGRFGEEITMDIMFIDTINDMALFIVEKNTRFSSAQILVQRRHRKF